MAPRSTAARDAGLALISRINRWLIAVAIGLTGVVSVTAATSFKGHATSRAAATTPSTAPSGDSGSDDGGSLQAPAQAPTPAPAPGGGAVSSGGS